MVLAVYAALPAFAVHDENFQLDGDVLASTTTNVGGNTQNLDWDSLFTSLGAPKALPAGFTASGFDRDFGTNPGCSLTAQTGTYCTSDDTTFATGSKDTLPITPGWQCNHDANVNSKIDIDNSYAGAYTNAAGEQILYFGMERNTNTGDANVGFWFLQDDVGCSSASGTHAFTGDHSDGDLLIVSAFTNGGSVSTIDVYRWVGGANGALNPTPVAHGVDCRDPATGTGDTACAVANTAPITTPWLTAAKTLNPNVGHTLPTAQFFEGGLNLTKANLGGKCFNVFIGDTRSSQSLTATLFDFARGKIGECTVSMTTTPSQTTRVLGSSAPITDSADVVGSTSGGGTAPTPTGSVTFFLCNPSQLNPASTGVCDDDNGTQVGSPVTVTEKVPGTATATSADAQTLITGLGKYCFRAQFVADPNDPNYPGQTADTSNPSQECFTVTGTAGLSTAQDWRPNDTATLTGDANLNGTLTFTLYHSADCTGTPVSGQTYTVTVTNAASGSTFNTSNTTFFVRDANQGAYSWKVHYDDTTLSDPADRCEHSVVTVTDS